MSLKKQILVVEDNQINREMLRMIPVRPIRRDRGG